MVIEIVQEIELLLAWELPRHAGVAMLHSGSLTLYLGFAREPFDVLRASRANQLSVMDAAAG